MAFTKPNVNTPWGFDAGDGILEPLPAKVAQGWIAEIPDYEYENWIQNRQDQFNAHVNERGIPVWDSSTNYLADKSYVQGSDGVIYRALTGNTNRNPTTNPSDWVKAFDAAETSYTKADADDRFLQKSKNLEGLTNKAAARVNLNVYSKSESDAKFQEESELSSMIVAFPVSSAPTGWLACDGAAVARSSYPTLFARIGTSFGAGDGSTTFNVPDLRGEFIRGWDDGRGVDAGRSFGSFQGDEIKSHNHSASTGTAGNHYHSGSTSTNGYHQHSDIGRSLGDADGSPGGQGWSGSHLTGGAGSHNHSFNTNYAGSHTHTVSIGNTGGSETRPRNVALLYCIKT